MNAISVSPASADGYILKRDVVNNARFHPTAQGASITKPDIYSLSYAYKSYNDFSRKVKHDNNEYDILGITDTTGTIGNIECGIAKPSFDLIIRMADILSINPAQFFSASRFSDVQETLMEEHKMLKDLYHSLHDIRSHYTAL